MPGQETLLKNQMKIEKNIYKKEKCSGCGKTKHIAVLVTVSTKKSKYEVKAKLCEDCNIFKLF